MSRSIGGQSRVYQPVSGGVVSQRARVLAPVVPEGCVYTESFNKGDGTLGPDLAWTLPSAPWYAGTLVTTNPATVDGNQFGVDLAAPGADGTYYAQGIMTEPLCDTDVYAEATISTLAINLDEYDLVAQRVGAYALWLRADLDSTTIETAAVFSLSGPPAPTTYGSITTSTGFTAGDYNSTTGAIEVTLEAGQRMRFEAEGTSYRGYLDDVLIVEHTETSYTPRGTHAGLSIVQGYDWTPPLCDMRLDAFEAGNL